MGTGEKGIMNLQGDFEGLTLTSILQLLCNEQKTGVLTIFCRGGESRILFEQGNIVHVAASLKIAEPGLLILNDGLVSDSKFQECLCLVGETQPDLGKIMVEKEYISPDILEKYTAKKVEIILYNLLLWEKGRFEYEDIDLDLKGVIKVLVNPMKLILEASRRSDELLVIRESIPRDSLVFKLGKVQNQGEVKTDIKTKRLLSLVDGIRSLGQIMDESGYDEFTIYKIFFSMISSGWIEQGEELQVSDGERYGEGSIGYSAVFTLFDGIFQSIKKNSVDELGQKGIGLFEESKEKLSPQTKEIFKNYHPDNHKIFNLQSINLSLKNLEEVKNRKAFLIKGYTQYCSQILKKVGSILGERPLNKVLDDIDHQLGEKYQTGSKDIKKIVDDMGTLIGSMRFEAQEGESKKGFFSFFS
jgi:hypothetical protein